MNYSKGIKTDQEVAYFLRSIRTNINTWGLSVVLVFGYIGTFMNMFLCKQKKFESSSSAYYLFFSALANLIILSFSITRRMLIDGFELDIGDTRFLWWCRTRFFIAHMGYFISGYMLILASLDRVLSVCRKVKYRRLCTRSIAQRVTITSIITLIIMNIHVVILFKIKNKQCYAHGLYRLFFDLWSVLGQNIIIIVCVSILDLLTAYKTEVQLHKLDRFDSRAHRLKAFQRSVYIQTLIICLLLLPRGGHKLWVTLRPILDQTYSPLVETFLDKERDRLIETVLSTLNYIYYSLPFYFYSLTVPMYRRELWRTISAIFHLNTTQPIPTTIFSFRSRDS